MRRDEGVCRPNLGRCWLTHATTAPMAWPRFDVVVGIGQPRPRRFRWGKLSGTRGEHCFCSCLGSVRLSAMSVLSANAADITDMGPKPEGGGSALGGPLVTAALERPTTRARAEGVCGQKVAETLLAARPGKSSSTAKQAGSQELPRKPNFRPHSSNIIRPRWAIWGGRFCQVWPKGDQFRRNLAGVTQTLAGPDRLTFCQHMHNSAKA